MSKLINTFFISLSFLVCTTAYSATVSLDQQQLKKDVLLGMNDQADIAQTFTAGFDQILNSIQVYTAITPNRYGSYPLTVTLMDTISGKPSNNVLASLSYMTESLHSGWVSFDFSSKNILLTKGHQYAIAFDVDDPNPDAPSEIAFDYSKTATSYLGGSIWVSLPSNGVWGPVAPDNIVQQLTFQTYGTPVPLPASAWLLGSGIFALLRGARRNK